jgi:hypothetical protein
MANTRYLPIEFNGDVFEFGFDVEKLSIRPESVDAMVSILLEDGYNESEIKDVIELIDSDFIAANIGFAMKEAMDKARSSSAKMILLAMKKA